MPGVAEALARLMSSLGGHVNTGGEVALPAAAAAAAAASVTEKPSLAAYMAAAAAPVAPAPVEAAPAPKPKKPRKPANDTISPEEAEALAKMTDDERYEKWFSQLPENSRHFLTELEKAGTLTLGEAVEILKLSSPRGMGGLTGSMKRWAKRYGITNLPFIPGRNENTGERFWTWRGR